MYLRIFMLLWGFILSLHTDPARDYRCGNCDDFGAATGEAGRRLWRQRCGAEAKLSEERFRVLQRGPGAKRQGESRSPRFFLVVRPRRVPRGDGRRSWRRLVGEPAGRSSQQPRYTHPAALRRDPSPRPFCAPQPRPTSGGHRLRPAEGRAAVGAAYGCGARNTLTRETDGCHTMQSQIFLPVRKDPFPSSIFLFLISYG